MRWQQLFADLEAQLEAQEVRELALEVADRTRRERALLGMPERLLGHRGRALQLRLLGGQVLAGEVVDVGLDWCLLAEEGGRSALVPTSALLTLRPDDGSHHREGRDDGSTVRVRACRARPEP